MEILRAAAADLIEGHKKQDWGQSAMTYPTLEMQGMHTRLW
jgi:hypothetical protein